MLAVTAMAALEATATSTATGSGDLGGVARNAVGVIWGIVNVTGTVTGRSGSAAEAVNATFGYPQDVDADALAADSFFQMYYSMERFAAECILALLAAACNLTGLLANKGHLYQHPVYHILFKNLGVANTLAVSMSWITNNSIFFFAEQLQSIPNMCHVLLLLLALNLFATAFGLISGMTLVGFSVIHYLAICWPLRYDAMVTVQRVRAGIVGIWLIGPAIAFWPMPAYFIYTFGRSGFGFCSADYVGYLNVISADVAMGTMAVCYVALTCMCLRLYHEVHQLQRRLSENLWVDDLKYEKRALVTIVMLLSTLTLFFLPYYVVYMVSMNSWSANLNRNQAVLYYMMLLPYIKYASDPIIYGKRMLGLQEELRRKLITACCSRIVDHLRSSSNNTRKDCTKKGNVYQMVSV